MDETVPGTVHLVDIQGELNVKHGSQNIILIPAPSSDLNDPLRWSHKKKFVQFFVLFWLAVFYAIAVGWHGPVWIIWTQDLDCRLYDLSILQALQFLFLGLGCLFLQPTALKLGRRFVYMLCALLIVISSIIGDKAENVHYLWGAAILAGLGAAPCDSLVEISTADVFFQHERATYLSLFIFALYFGNYIAPAVTGFIAQTIGWRWCYKLLAILFGAYLVVMAFTMEDTTFRREHDVEAQEHDILVQIKSRESSVAPPDASDEKKAYSVDVDSQQSKDSEEKLTAVRPYWKRMNPIQTKYNDTRSWLCIWYRPFFMIVCPAVVWGGLVYGAQMMWLAWMASTSASTYGTPPYNFSAGSVGLTNLAPLVGNIFGMVYGGPFVDWLAIKLAQRNNGVFEPEFRLYAMIMPTLINGAGIIAYGIGAVNSAPWPVLVVVGQGFMGFAMSSTGGICLSYVMDSYSKMASEVMVLMLFIRNMIGMGFTFGLSPWIVASGHTQITWLLFMVSMAINGSFIFMIIYGKRMRRATKGLYYKFSDPMFGEIFK